MELQKILFPKPEICMAEQLYYRPNERCRLDAQNSILVFEKDGYAEFNTYFNGFSMGKWKKYTILETLKLEIEISGVFVVSLVNYELINGAVVAKVVDEQIISAADRKRFTFSYEGFHQKGIHGFILCANTSQAMFFGGRYFTDEVSPEQLPEVKLALNMCTFRREKYIYQNVARLMSHSLENPKSPLYQKLFLYITDNAMTLDETRLESPYIHVTKQNAFGSVGGFTRGLINILDDREELGLTHALMLDDDIVLDPEILCRVYVLFRMMKEEYREAWLGGGMLGLDFPTLQTESGGVIENGEYKSLKAYMDIGAIFNLLYNEIEERAKINAWWFCGIPLTSIAEDKLPYPVYFHCDDMEYANRCCQKLILVNGICVWHEEFFYKPNTYYYDRRNWEILYVLHFPAEATKKKAKKRLVKNVVNEILWYRYRDAVEIIDGVLDFLKGPNWLVAFDDREKFEQVRKNRVPNVPVTELPIQFDYNQYLASLSYPGERRRNRLFRKLTLNGWLLPAKRDAIVRAETPLTYHFYRAKRVLNYSAKTHSGYISCKSYYNAICVLWQLLKTLWKIDLQYNIVKQAYQSSLPQLTNKAFWKNVYGEK